MNSRSSDAVMTIEAYLCLLHQEKTFSDALDWYNYSLSLFRSGGGDVGDVGEENLAKLHRNRANCHIGLQQLSQVTFIMPQPPCHFISPFHSSESGQTSQEQGKLPHRSSATVTSNVHHAARTVSFHFTISFSLFRFGGENGCGVWGRGGGGS